VMDCGDAGHVLVSKRVADDLGEYEHWRPLLHDLGECEVKHGMRVSIANLHADQVGNPQPPKKFQTLKKRSARMRWAATTAALVALAAIVAGIAMFSRYRVRSTLAAPEKSITQHALSYIFLRRFPEALRKFDQVLNITPDDLDTLVVQAGIAQAEGDLPRASAILAPLHPPADDSSALEIQAYQAILERRPAQIIPRLKEILAKPDPALGYNNGELRFWLGWAQEVDGDHAAAQESWRQSRSELESFLKEQPENYNLIGDLALTNMGLGNKAAALALAERAMAVLPIETDAVTGPTPIEILARVAARMGEPDRAIAALQKLLSIPYQGAVAQNVPLTPALLRLDPMFDPLRNDPRFQKLVASPAPKSADK
jgi:tetratricopeptide (TPR) repeat protein